jgi:membrane associated rhomboid family serine protease
MLPLGELRDPAIASAARRPPMIVSALVVSNLFAFIGEQAMVEAGATRFPLVWGLVPRVLTERDPLHGAVTVLTSMFLHGGWFHLIGNLWFLWIFGRAVEDALGHARFLALYLLGGVAAAAAQVAVDPGSTMPMLGASGAIGGVLAAYVSLFPWRRVRTLVPILVFPLILNLPAAIFVLEWFAMNLVRGVFALRAEGLAGGGVAWWAHVGGFLAGLLLVRLLFPEDEARSDRGGPFGPRGRAGGARRVVVRDPESGEEWPSSS